MLSALLGISYMCYNFFLEISDLEGLASVNVRS